MTVHFAVCCANHVNWSLSCKTKKIELMILFHLDFNFSSPGKGKGKQMEDQGQVENPSDFSDPSVEQNERLLAIDEEITDDDDKVIAEKLESQASGGSPAIECLRSLVCVDKSSKH